MTQAKPRCSNVPGLAHYVSMLLLHTVCSLSLHGLVADVCNVMLLVCNYACKVMAQVKLVLHNWQVKQW